MQIMHILCIKTFEGRDIGIDGNSHLAHYLKDEIQLDDKFTG